MMNRRIWAATAAAWLALSAGLPMTAAAAEETPDALVKRVSADVLETIRKDPSLKTGDVARIGALVDKMVMPHVNFQRMTAAAVGPQWRQATPEQKQRLQAEFKSLLIRTYAGAVAQVNDQTVVVKPMRAAAGDKDVLVRTEVRGKGDPIQLDYRLEQSADGAWRIYNLNVLGVWLVETYRSQFAQEVNARGIDGLIQALSSRNKG
ncbi:MlaC/ttg2D family ABC transporter substrate-binding protein [Comamonas antarctica]|jgi:phospholipid transport system substrate-binding protein|uniref:ABC transporter substrate-binding protein n=1 Tax=Comamonas antarctica TaxID=2743470 RepID=A0A6N1X8T3_9BURK|nr:ABC transporter substrate-binding protein [Comamonas antarctica]QKV54275.1 ABC transporter substrate-binding protein [Comamonas antarctica]